MGNWNVNHHGKLKVQCHLLGMSMKKGASLDQTKTLGIVVTGALPLSHWVTAEEDSIRCVLMC